MEWFKRWRQIGYRELWHLHLGGAHEGDKGCQREYDFMLEVTSGWREVAESERSLRVEAEELLLANGIEPPTITRLNSLNFAIRNRKRL
jgi:hypothetical protein